MPGAYGECSRFVRAAWQSTRLSEAMKGRLVDYACEISFRFHHRRED
jgi:hypothetical protein